MRTTGLSVARKGILCLTKGMAPIIAIVCILLISSCGGKNGNPTPPPPPKVKSKLQLITQSSWKVKKLEFENKDLSWIERPLYANQVYEKYSFNVEAQYIVTPDRGPLQQSVFEYAFVADSTQVQIIRSDFHLYEWDVITQLDEKTLVTTMQEADGVKEVASYTSLNPTKVEKFVNMRITYGH